MEIPAQLMASLQGTSGFDETGFRSVHESDERITSIRINPLKPARLPYEQMERVPWSTFGYYLPSRPLFTFDPFIHAGAYYVQEASSMFLEQCLRQHADLSKPLKVLDLCAAPGGKSTLIQSLLNENSLLVSNEVIKTRVSALSENMVKWGSANNIVTNNDPKDFERLENYFDIIVVDAPCSGSGLFRRDPSAIAEWSVEAVNMCSLRQQRILKDVFPALNAGGLLVYSTCSYSREEDEDITDWLLQEFPVEFLPVHADPDWHIAASAGYRFFPDKLRGEGFYISCFRKTDGDTDYAVKRTGKLQRASAVEAAIAAAFVAEPARHNFYQLDTDIYAFPAELETDLQLINANLYTKKAGVLMGRVLNTGLIPAHPLAVSTIAKQDLPRVALNKEEALQYLRKEDLKIADGRRGWALVAYENLPLGWVKLLNNRINNYYPREWRILKAGNK